MTGVPKSIEDPKECKCENPSQNITNGISLIDRKDNKTLIVGFPSEVQV